MLKIIKDIIIIKPNIKIIKKDKINYKTKLFNIKKLNMLDLNIFLILIT